MLISAIAWKLWPETEVLQEVDDATIHHRGFWLTWKTSAELKKFFGLSDNPAMFYPVCRQVTKSSCLFSWRLAALKKSSWPNWSKLTRIGRPRGPGLSVPCYSNIDSTIWRQLQRIPRKFQHRLPSWMLANFLESMQASQPGLICFCPKPISRASGRADARFNTVRSKIMSFHKMTNEQPAVR